VPGERAGEGGSGLEVRAAERSSPAETSWLRRSTRPLRSAAFFALYFVYLICPFGIGNRLLGLWARLRPARRRMLVGAWFRFLADTTLGLARLLANVRLSVEGTIPDEACVVVMNHQSLLDIPIAYSLVRGPYPLIPTRRRYARGIPGVSPLVRLARLPLIGQDRTSARADIKALAAAATEVLRGEQSLLIFPEGHRTRDGSISPFMKSGLRVVLERAQRPVYLVVEDGLWHARTTAEAIFRFADTSGCVAVVGPIDPPAKGEVDGFIDSLEERMATTLLALRTTEPRT
jgi:1-acyl-sn-glycerol-3-phosphate acyltransferase